MSTQIIKHVYRFKRGTEEAIFNKNPVLLAGEPLVVLCDDNIIRFKIGDGRTEYVDLPFINQENDQSLKALIKEVELLKDEINNAGDVVFKIDGEILASTSGSSVSKRISNYIRNINPIEMFIQGNVAIISTPSKDVLGGYVYETYTYDGQEWLANGNIYIVDNNSIVMRKNRFELKGFAEASNNTVALKKNNKLQWMPLENILPESSIQGIDPEDKLLTLNDQTLNTSIKLIYKNDTNEILLIGKDDKPINTIDASNFLINNMLNSLSYNSETGVLTFVWNTAQGKQTNSVEINAALEPYKSGDGIKIAVDQSIGIVIDDSSEQFISVSSKGIKLSGIQNLVQISKQDAITTSSAYTDKSIKDFISAYITNQEETLEKLEEIKKWIAADESGTVQLIQDVTSNTESAKRHDEEISRLSQEITTLQLEGNTTYEFESVGKGIFKVVSSAGNITEIDTGSKVYTDEAVKSLETYIDEQLDALSAVYVTDSDVQSQIENKLNDLELHVIDGGWITDGNSSN
jgi:hypothetical protein